MVENSQSTVARPNQSIPAKGFFSQTFSQYPSAASRMILTVMPAFAACS